MAFARLDLQAAVFLGLRAPVLNLLHTNDRLMDHGDPYRQAEDGLTTLMNRIFKFLRFTADHYRYRKPGSIPLHILAEAQELETELHEFSKYIEPGLQAKHVPDEVLPEQIASLKIMYYLGTIIMATSLHAEETIYDQFVSEFGSLVDAAAEILSYRPQGVSATSKRKGFSLDMTVIYPLYMAAIKCRCPALRRRAIDTLRMAPRSEGAWEADVYVHIAERVIEMEEDGQDLQELATEPTEVLAIPEWRRVHSVDIDIGDPGRPITFSMRRRLNGVDGNWDDTEESISRL